MTAETAATTYDVEGRPPVTGLNAIQGLFRFTV
jgi:hypothetical protein